MSDGLGNLMGGERRRGHVRNAYACGHKTESSEAIDHQVLGQSRIPVVINAHIAGTEIDSDKACRHAGLRRA